MGHFSSHLNQEKSDLAEIVLGRRDGNGKGSAAPQVESLPKSPTHSFLIPYTSSLGDREPSCSVLILQHLSHSLQLLNSFPKGGGYNYCSTNSRARNTSLLSFSEMTIHWSLSPSAAAWQAVQSQMTLGLTLLHPGLCKGTVVTWGRPTIAGPHWSVLRVLCSEPHSPFRAEVCVASEPCLGTRSLAASGSPWTQIGFPTYRVTRRSHTSPSCSPGPALPPGAAWLASPRCSSWRKV